MFRSTSPAPKVATRTSRFLALLLLFGMGALIANIVTDSPKPQKIVLPEPDPTLPLPAPSNPRRASTPTPPLPTDSPPEITDSPPQRPEPTDAPPKKEVTEAPQTEATDAPQKKEATEATDAPQKEEPTEAPRKGGDTATDSPPAKSGEEQTDAPLTKEEAEKKEKEDALKADLKRLARRRKGVFVNKAHRPGLSETVLVTMTNWGFRKFFFNWVCYARQLGLDYIVLSIDVEMHNFLGSSRSVLMDNVSGKQEWGTASYYDMGCHKLEAIQYLLEMGYDVLFSDPDNVIGKMPADLLQEMEERKYEMLIQADHKDCLTRSECPVRERRGRTANGGFYYYSANRTRQMTRLLKRAVYWCLKKPRSKLCCDDQQAVNRALKELTESPLQGGFKGTEFCMKEDGASPQNLEALQYCVMDPEQHPAGNHPIKYEKLKSFHANWILKEQNKISRLNQHGLWQWEEDSRCLKEGSLMADLK